MNFLKKGPELKRPEMKVPDFLYDLFYDLKERHLLPVVAILLVAIVAMPILIKSKNSSEEEPSAVPAIASGNAAGNGEAISVARSTPGLRDIRKRLKHFRKLDPFQQKLVLPGAAAVREAAAEAAAEGPETETPAEAIVIGGETPTEPTETTGPIVVPSEEPVYTPGGASNGEGSEGSGPTRTRYASTAIDVRIVTLPPESGGAKKKPSVQVRHELPELTMLPDRGTPAVSFMGTTRDGKKALLVVSSDVDSIFGEADCIIGSQSCQLLAVEPNMPVTFVYGAQEKRFRIEVLKVSTTLSSKPHRASLGGSSGNGGGGDEGGNGEGGGASNGSESTGGDEPAERGGNGGASEGGGGGGGASGGAS
jgi:hypothetical protein